MVKQFIFNKKLIRLFFTSFFLLTSFFPNTQDNFEDKIISDQENQLKEEIDLKAKAIGFEEEYVDKEIEELNLETTTIQTTLKRTILKSIIETSWNAKIYYGHKKSLNIKNPITLLEIKKQDLEKTEYNYYQESFNYNEIGKILSNLLIDEYLHNPKSSNKQKLIELFIPTITSFLIIDCATKNIVDKKELKVLNLSAKLLWKLFQKLTMVRFLQEPGTKSYNIANTFAILSACYDPLKSNNYISYENITICKGAERFILDQLKTYLLYQDLGPKLNSKARKKAFGKIAQVITKPHVQKLILELYANYKQMAK